MKQLNPSIKHHLIIGALLCIWSFLFAFFVRPFEHGEMDLQKWVSVSIGFSLTAFLSYVVITFVQYLIYKKKNSWSIRLEVSMYLLYYIVYTMVAYLYYKSPIIEGFYSISEFMIIIIFPIFLIVTPVLFLARRYSIKLIPEPIDEIILKGENKLDILKIKRSDLICISNSQNYVEVFYLDHDQLQTKLIRSSLKKIQSDFDFLIQIHRSHLINPAHFKSWKDSSTITLTHIELPVSKSYKNKVLTL
jgi:uncharacterized membrane protein YhdT